MHIEINNKDQSLASAQVGSPPAPVKKTGIALDSLEPVIVSGVSGSTATSASGQNTINPNNPSPQNFASSAKGIDLLQGGDILQPRGDPQFVGLTKLTYQAGEIQLAQGGTVEPCSLEDFQDCFIEKTLNHYYKLASTSSSKQNKQGGGALNQQSPSKGAHSLFLATNNNAANKNAVTSIDGSSDLSPERTRTTKARRSGSKDLNSSGRSKDGGKNNSADGKKDDKLATSRLLQQVRRAPYEYSKVSFVIALPYEMLIEQLQLILPPNTKPRQSSGFEESPEGGKLTTAPDKGQSAKSSSKTKKQNNQHGAGNMMNITSNNNPSQVISMQQSEVAAPKHQPLDPTFSQNFKILNISTLKSPEHALNQIITQNSTDSRQRTTSQIFPSTQARQYREHRHMQVKSAFSEQVTGKSTIEINACAVTKYLHVTLLCLRQDAAALFNHWKANRAGQSLSSNNSQQRRGSKTSVFDASSKTAPQQLTTTHAADDQGLKVTGAQRLIAEIENFDILDEHDYEVAFISKQHYQQTKGASASGVSDIIDHEQIGMQLRGDDEDFERDLYDEVDLAGFKVGSIINNDEDDLRILDSLPQTIKPKVPQQHQHSVNSKKQSSIKLQRSLKFEDQQATSSVNIGGGPLGRFIDKIIVYGFNCNQIPAITNLTYFMNQSFYMRKHKKYYQAEEVDYLVGTLMITTKRATQAAEYYRKMEANVIKRIQRNLTKLEKQQSEDCSSNNATFIGGETEIRQETQSLFIQCSLFELLIADSLSFETQLNEKVQALQRLVTFMEGVLPGAMRFAPQVLVYDDSFSALLRILPQLLRFCLLSLTHRREIVRMSALKILKFILETQGCSLDASMIYILKGMFLTFPKPTSAQAQAFAQAEKEAAEKLRKQQQSLDDSPSARSQSTAKANEEPESATWKKLSQQRERVKIIQNDFDLAQLVGESEAVTISITDYVFYGQSRNSLLSNSANNMIMQDSNVIAVEPESSLYATKYAAIQEPSSGFNNALQNVHSHVLETYISVLSSISSHILHRIFYDVIEDALCAASSQSAANSSQKAPKHSSSFKNTNQNQSLSGGPQDTTSTKLQSKPSLFAQSSQIRVYACKIAEKIITICQGDLNISTTLLNALIDAFGAAKPTPPLDSASNQAHAAMKNLWNSIKQKVFPNYSTKGYRRLIEWLSHKMNHLMNSQKTHSLDLLNTKPVKQQKDAFPDELSDEENIILQQLCEVITLVTFNRLKQEEEANQLIKLPTPESFGNGASSEMYLLLPQLMFWLEYAIDREDRLQLFTQLYQTIKEVLESVPTNGRSRENQLTVVHIMMPSLRRTNEFLKSNSPSLPMLKFMEIALGDIQLCAHERKSKQQNLSLSPTTKHHENKQFQSQAPDNSISDPLKLQGFFLELLENFVTSLAYSLYEEAFTVFDKLLYLAGEAISETAIKKCIVAFVDKYTLKSKSHKASMAAFMKQLMNLKVKRNNQSLSISRSNHKRQSSIPGSPEFEEMINENDLSGTGLSQAGSYFEVMAEFCFFENVDTNYRKASRNGMVRVIDDKDEHNNLGIAQLDFRGPIDMHELFVDKLQFFIDSLSLMTDAHIAMFTYLITNHSFKVQLLHLLEHSETNVRMKAHEILEALTSYFVQCCPSKTVYEFPHSGSSSHQQQHMADVSGKKMEAEFIAHERLFISQIVIQVAKKSLAQTHDCYLQFNALILLDFLFQNLLPVPTFQNEQVKARKQNRRAHQQTPSAQDQATDLELTMDIEVLSISDMTPELDVMDPAYLRMRMKLVMSLWPHIQAALASPWSNIRSICYGLVCSMLKINVSDYPVVPVDQQMSREVVPGANMGTSNANNTQLSESMQDPAALSSQEDRPGMSDMLSLNSAATQNRLKEIVLPMLFSLLSSKESESKAGGLNILGSFCGLSYDFSQVKINENLAFLQRNSEFISLPIWRLVYQLQDDWDITIKEASVVLVQLCAPRQAILYFQSLKEKRQQQKLQYLMNQMPNVQSIYVKSKGLGAEDEEEKGQLLRGIRPESRLKIKNYMIKRNEHAARAYSRFPNEADLEVILSQTLANGRSARHTAAEKPDEASFSILQESTVIQDGAFVDQNGHFSDYLSGKIPMMTPPIGSHQSHHHPYDFVINCQNIDNEHMVLAEKVQKACPDYEDTRFMKNLSRKRQLEIELDMGRGRKRDNQTALNFFVDTYSDEQIQEIISIFRNDFKPPKNLWIEKQPSPQALSSGGMSNGAQMSQSAQTQMRSQSPDYYQDIYAEAIEIFNQQQALMQQQQQAQLQQQVQSGGTSATSSQHSSQQRDSSGLSANSSQSSGSSASPGPQSTAQQPALAATGPPIVAESAASTAARLSPQPSGRMIDPLEDDQLRQLSEQQSAKSASSVGSNSNSASSRGGGQLNQSQEVASQQQKIMVNAFSADDDQQVELENTNQNQLQDDECDNRKILDDKQGTGLWSPDTEALQHHHNVEDDSQTNGPPAPGQQLQYLGQSESMGLLDAEGYKFLEESEQSSNNSEHDDDDDDGIVDKQRHRGPLSNANEDEGEDEEDDDDEDEEAVGYDLLGFRGDQQEATAAGHRQMREQQQQQQQQQKFGAREMIYYQDQRQQQLDQQQELIYEMRPPAHEQSRARKKRKAKDQVMKIEQLNFEGVQICASQPNSTSKKLKNTQASKKKLQQQHQLQKKTQQQVNNQMPPPEQQKLQQQHEQRQNFAPRIEFYQDPGEQQNQTSSRLGQRSSRLQYQEELQKQQQQQQRQKQSSKQQQQLQQQLQPDDEAKLVLTQKKLLKKQLKSPTDKIAGSGKATSSHNVNNVYKSFAATSDGLLQIQSQNIEVGGSIVAPQQRNKSNESRKRKRTHGSNQNVASSATNQAATGKGRENKGLSFADINSTISTVQSYTGTKLASVIKQTSAFNATAGGGPAAKNKPHHLKLVENDYFSSDDKHMSNLRNLTQKAAHQYQGGLGPWQWTGGGAGTNANTTQSVKSGMPLLPGQNSTRHRAKSIGNANSISTPDFNLLQNKLGLKPGLAQGSAGLQEGLRAESSSDMIDQNKISRKMAQTYLSGLSKGFISKMDNLKLINTCLHQDLSSTAAGSVSGANVTSKAASSMLLNKSMGHNTTNTTMQKPSHHSKKLLNKSYENLSGGQPKLKQSSNNGSLLVDLQLQNPKSAGLSFHQTNKTTRHGGKNSTLSTSPQRRDGSHNTNTALNSSSNNNYQRKQKSIEKGGTRGNSKKNKQLHYQQQTSSESKDATGSGQKSKRSKISDLHHMIKTIEKDLTEKFKNMKDLNSAKGPATPNQILRKVEDQMRAFGLDPKSGSNQATAQALALKFAQSEQAAHNLQQNSTGPLSAHSQEKQQTAKRKKSMPPKLKLLGLQFQSHGIQNQTQQNALQMNNGLNTELNSAVLFPSSCQDVTPSNLSSNGSGSRPFMTKSHINIHGNQFSRSSKKHYERSSGSRGRRKRSGGNRDRSAGSRTSRHRTKSGQLSTGRGASSGSGGRAGPIQTMIPNPPMVMTERCIRPTRPATGGKSSQERVSHQKGTLKSMMKGGSALAKTSKPTLHKIQKQSKQSAFSPTNQSSGGTSKQKTSKPSVSAMNQIGTSRQTDKKLLEQLLKANSGSTSVRNKPNGTMGQKTGQMPANPFLSNSINKQGVATQKLTPGPTKGSQTYRQQPTAGNQKNNIGKNLSDLKEP